MVCIVDGCDTVARSRGMCNAHHLRWLRRGTTERTRAEDRNALCGAPECDRHVWAKGLCTKHYQRVQRNGDLDVRSRRQPPTTYRSAHKHIEYAKGKASQRECWDCGEPADHWSYIGPDRGPLTWSDDPCEYLPRCAPCHGVYDAATRK